MMSRMKITMDNGIATILSGGDHEFYQRLNFGMNGKYVCNMIIVQPSSLICNRPIVIVYQGYNIVDFILQISRC